MNFVKRYFSLLLAALLLVGCAGIERGCTSWTARKFGADWIIVQYNTNGEPYNCWQLHNVSVENEHASDGIHWLDSSTGHLIHISGWYNSVQVGGGRFDQAAKVLGIDLAHCPGGKYIK